eukprot:COSAG05_NODE_593_length_8488_cov_13.560367_4_plen_59_part_00
MQLHSATVETDCVDAEMQERPAGPVLVLNGGRKSERSEHETQRSLTLLRCCGSLPLRC